LLFHNYSRLLPPLLWAILIFAVSADPNPYRTLAAWLGLSSGGAEAPRLLPWLTNESLGQLLHFAEFAILGALTQRALAQRALTARVAGGREQGGRLAAAMCLAYALFDELHQAFVPGRTFQLPDLALDALGALLGIYLHRLLVNLS
jgi:VanZ family protein